MRFEFKVDLKKVRHKQILKKPEINKEFSLRLNLVLAYQIQELLEKNKARNLKQISQWLNMTKARISQIMNLLLLAPDIQEEILLSDKQAISYFTEHKIRKIPLEINWEKQRKMWESIKNS